MKNHLKKGMVAVALFVSLGANANLILNGGFETPDVNANTWKWYTSNNVEGWNGSTIEVWEDFLGVSAYEGSQFAELNAHGNSGNVFSIYQTFDTQIDSTYDFSLAYRARRNNNEAFSLSFLSNNQVFEQQTFDDHVVGSWSTFSNSFVALDSTTTIKFTSITPSTGTVGNFLDDIQVLQRPTELANSIDEPATIALVSLSVIGAIALRRRKKALVIKH